MSAHCVIITRLVGTDASPAILAHSIHPTEEFCQNTIKPLAPNKKLTYFSTRLVVVFVQSIEARYYVEIEDIVRAAPLKQQSLHSR